MNEKRWLFDSTTEAASTFRICSACGAVYHITNGDSSFYYCPKCGQQMEVKEDE